MAATSTNQIKDQSLSLTKRLFPWTLYALIPIALLHFYLNPLSFPPSPESELPHSLTSHFSPPSGTHTLANKSKAPTLVTTFIL